MTGKTYLKASLAALLALILIAGCGSKKSSQQTETVVTTFLPLHAMTLDLLDGLGDINVVSLAPSTAGCPDHYAMTPSDLTTLRNSTVVIRHGLGLDRWLDSHLDGLGEAGVPVVTLTDTLEGMLEMEGAHHEMHGKHEDHNHSGLLHTWTSPDLTALEVTYLAEQLAARFPQYSDSIEIRGSRLAGQLNELYAKYSNFGQRHEHAKVALFHDSFSLMLERIGLDVALVLQPDPDVSPGPRRTSELIKMLSGDQIEALFSEPQINVQFARMIQEGSGREIISLNSLVTGEAETGILLSTLKENLEEMYAALEEKR